MINLARESTGVMMAKVDTHKFRQKAWTYRIIPGKLEPELELSLAAVSK